MHKPHSSEPAKVHRIEIKLREISQLFNSMEPAPFHEKDLDHDAEEYIESWVSEFLRQDPVTLSIHLQQFPAEAIPRLPLRNVFTTFLVTKPT